MRQPILTTAFLLLSISLLAQTKTLPLQENKYIINLPEYWGKGNKVWQVLTDKLPLICEELKDKELCGDDCNPRYTVELYMTEAGDFAYYNRNISPAPFTNTRPLAAMTGNPSSTHYIPQPVYNPERQYYSQNSNIWKITTTYNFQAYLVLVDHSGKVITKMVLVDMDETWLITNTVNLSSTGNFNANSPAEFIENNKEKVTPTLFNMLAVVEEKILAL